MGYCCADCAKLNLNDQNKWGEFWCGERGHYYPGSDSICSYFVARGDGGGGCYLTTIVVHCLGYDDYCQYLQKLRHFRDEVMKKDEKYEDLLQEYNLVGPILAQSIEADENKRILAERLLQKYISPVCDLLDWGKHDQAVALYKEMVAELEAKYMEGRQGELSSL